MLNLHVGLQQQNSLVRLLHGVYAIAVNLDLS